MAQAAPVPLLPPPPPAELDDLLDAAQRCFARFGVSRTSVPDIAAELGVDRTTVYRRAGAIEQISLMLASREMHRFLDGVSQLGAATAGPETVVEAVATVVERAANHPVIRKVVSDERDLIGSLMARHGGEFIRQTSSFLAPMLAQGMKDGRLAPRDPQIVAQWIVRMGLSLVFVDANSDVRSLLGAILVPALTPQGAKPSRRTKAPAKRPAKPTRRARRR